MIQANNLIAQFDRMYTQHWKYTAGAAAEGDVDCSGAFVYAYRQFHQGIAHGSNAIARQYVKGLLPISAAQPGMAAFKLRKPGDPKYALPAKYKPGGSAYNGDLNDYYHIGLVDSTGKYVLNAQGTNAGFTRTKLSTWAVVGYLKAVDYGQSGTAPSKPSEEMMTMQMIVTSTNGEPVRVRAHPSTAAETIARLKVGTKVDAGDDTNGWRPIAFGDDNGYMMSKFLKPADESAVPGYVKTLTDDEFAALCDARDKTEEVLKTLKQIVGVG